MRKLTVVVIIVLSALVATTAMSQRPSWLPERYRTPAVYGYVVDSSTGKRTSRVAITVEGVPSLGFSYQDGRYTLFDLAPGVRHVSFFCPVQRMMMGRKIAERFVAISATTDSLVDFQISLVGCSEPEEHTWTGEFRGHYVSGFETSRFTPCAPLEKLDNTAYEGFDQVAWVWFSDSALTNSGVNWPARDTADYPSVFVRWRASVTGPGMFGHMGHSPYEMRVLRVLSARRAAAGDCR